MTIFFFLKKGMRDGDDLQVPTIIYVTTKIISKSGVSRERESKENGAYTALKPRPFKIVTKKLCWKVYITKFVSESSWMLKKNIPV